ncbi:MAG: HPr family phosphocarrier protein [Sphaerochaetaceae bacterium]|jgi:phosphocarrier protein|nr:HPr family phosphocarrier protein [Sphaerochaetaceae bacterium]
MKTFKYTITDELGIHARPAGQFIKLSKSFNSTIRIAKDTKVVDGKRLIAVMSLGAKQGHEITVTCDGDDEDNASSSLETFLQQNL